MLSKLKSIKLISQFLAITLLMGLTVMMSVSDAGFPWYVEITLEQNGSIKPDPVSLTSASACISNGAIGDTVSLENPPNTDEIYYERTAAGDGYLYVNPDAITGGGTLDTSWWHTLGLENVIAPGYYKGAGTFALDGSYFLGELVLYYVEMVGLKDFTAEVDENGNVELNWETSTEVDNAGFNILKSVDDGPYIPMRDYDDLIPAEGTEESGAEYTYVDRVECGKTYSYILQDVDLDGTVTTHYEFTETVTPDCQE